MDALRVPWPIEDHLGERIEKRLVEVCNLGPDELNEIANLAWLYEVSIKDYGNSTKKTIFETALMYSNPRIQTGFRLYRAAKHADSQFNGLNIWEETLDLAGTYFRITN